jgi:mono/diheme cytochrome c family protein
MGGGPPFDTRRFARSDDFAHASSECANADTKSSRSRHPANTGLAFVIVSLRWLNLWQTCDRQFEPGRMIAAMKLVQPIEIQTRNLAVAAVIASTIILPATAGAERKSAAGDADAGRHLALYACTGCHIVSPNQPFRPIYAGLPHPPDFKEIASKPGVTAASLEHYLQSLPTVPGRSGMANMDLSNAQLRDIVAFILTLRRATTALER